MKARLRVLHPAILAGAVLAVLVVLGFALDEVRLGLAVRLLILALVGLSWNLMGGIAGLFSFGHAAYFGLGAYTSAILVVDHGMSPWIGMLAGAVVAGVFAAASGGLLLRYRLKGAHFALATFALAEMLRLTTGSFEFVHRELGFHVRLLPNSSLVKLQFSPDSPGYYFVALGLVALALVGTTALTRSRHGQMIMAARDDADAAASVGINVTASRIFAMALSGAIAGVAGAFYLQFYFFIDPDLAFGAAVSIQMLLPVIVGGPGDVWGPIVGAAALTPLTELTAGAVRHPPSFLHWLQGRSGLDIAAYGALLVVIVLFLPHGIYGSIRRRLRES